MHTIFSFLGELFRKSILAFFITTSIITALLLPFITLIGLSAAALSSETVGPELSTKYFYGKEASANKILTIPITGIIYGDSQFDGGDGGLFSSSNNTFGYDVKRTLRKAAADTNIKAIILEINSPGGTIYGSQALADGIASYKERTKKPVYAHVSGLAASGAYWTAVGADKIIADVGSSIGSIGVINGEFTVYNNPVALDGGLLGTGVTTKDGIESYYITSGKGKDLGNPFRKPTEEELRVLQTGAENNYKVFVKRVSEHRGIDEQLIRDDIGAYIYDNDTAITKKLLDMSGSREFAFAEIAKAAGVGDDFQVVNATETKSRLETLLSATMLFKDSTRVSSLEQHLTADFCTPHRPLVYYGDVARVCSERH